MTWLVAQQVRSVQWEAGDTDLNPTQLRCKCSHHQSKSILGASCGPHYSYMGKRRGSSSSRSRSAVEILRSSSREQQDNHTAIGTDRKVVHDEVFIVSWGTGI